MDVDNTETVNNNNNYNTQDGLKQKNGTTTTNNNNNMKVWHEEVKDDSKPPLKDVQISMKAETVVLQSPEIFH